MRIRLLIGIVISLLSISACQGNLTNTVLVMEVTREVPVTVVITVQPTNGPISLVTATATRTPNGTPVMTATPSRTPTQDPFPTPVVGQVFIADQLFERGRMFWIQPVGQIWVLTTDEDGNNIWQVYEDDFENGMLESDPTIVPPPGRYQPERGFGKLWRENPEIREALGWASTEELGYNTRYEYHAGGTLVNGVYEPASGYHVIENLTKEVFTFYEGSWTWEVSEPVP
jgi:hypothetical protein